MAAKQKPTAQQKRILNCVPSTGTEKDWLPDAAVEAGLMDDAAIPASIDLRDDTWWTIGNQGSTGSCVGWAAADSVLRWHFVKSGSITKADLLSVRFAWMASKETDELTSHATTFLEKAGTKIKAALEIAQKYGTVLETDLPFSGALSEESEAAFYSRAATRRINSYYNLVEGAPDKLASFRNWLANNGPIVTRFIVDSTWDNVGIDGKLTTYNPASVQRGHAVALVGYTKDGFIVRNSWGTGWGDKGYAFASNAYALAAFTEGYGVIV